MDKRLIARLLGKLPNWPALVRLVILAAASSLALLPVGSEAATTTRASVSDTEAEANNDSVMKHQALNSSGRFVTFESGATNLVASDNNGFGDVFVRSDLNGDGDFGDAGDTTVRLSLQDTGTTAGNNVSGSPAITPFGRFIVFQSLANNLNGAGQGSDTNGARDIFLRDRDPDADGNWDEAADLGSTSRVSITNDEAQSNGGSSEPVVSHDADYVAFESVASNLVSSDGNGAQDIFVRDRNGSSPQSTFMQSRHTCGTTVPGGGEGNADSALPSIDFDGVFVTFQSAATNLVGTNAGCDNTCESICDTGTDIDIFLRDRNNSATEIISMNSGEAHGNSNSTGPAPVSQGGRYVAFRSIATNLSGTDHDNDGNCDYDCAGDTNGQADIFVRDRTNGTTSRISLDTNEAQATGGDSSGTTMSLDGRYIAFRSAASDLVADDTNTCTGFTSPGTCPDIFVRDRDPDNDLIMDEPNAYTVRVSVDSVGVQGNDESTSPSISLTIPGVVAFASDATNLATGDDAAPHFRDILVHDADTDDDGILEPHDNCPLTANPGQENNVHPVTPVGDHCEDPEPDGVVDFSDNCPDAANPGQENNVHPLTPAGDHCEDPEPDGVVDLTDNCPDHPNAGQENNDGDAQGDACDTDDDNDSVVDPTDNCPMTANTDQANNDGDSAGDVCDPDDDNDTILDPSDNCQFMANTNQANNDGDSLGDVCDSDDDNDTITDPSDNCPLTANANQLNSDTDSHGDVCDNCPSVTNASQADGDGDLDGDPCDNCPVVPNGDQLDGDSDFLGNVCDLCASVADCDGDGWKDGSEVRFIGTDPLDACRDDPSDNAWPADINNDGFVDTADLALVTAVFGKAVPPAPARRSIAPEPPDAFIDTADIARITGLFGRACAAAATERASVDSGEAQANSFSSSPDISADGRFVAFSSGASNLVPGDTNAVGDIFVRDRLSGTTERVSVSSADAQADNSSGAVAISGDGRYVVFQSEATNLVIGDTNARTDVFVRDRLNGTTERVSVSSAGAQATRESGAPDISGDGRYVAFQSPANDLVAGDVNGAADTFVRDRVSGTTEMVSLSSSGAQGNNQSVGSDAPAVSGDGRFVAFRSLASNLVAGDTNAVSDIFVRDRVAGTTELASVDSTGAQANSDSHQPGISADGQVVVFYSPATNLVSGDTNGRFDVFVRDRASGTTERVSESSSGMEASADSFFPSISGNGRFAIFTSEATNLVAGDTNAMSDVFVHDRVSGLTERVSLGAASAQGNNHSGSQGRNSISGNGRFAAIDSFASNLVSGDTNGQPDIFVRDRATP